MAGVKGTWFKASAKRVGGHVWLREGPTLSYLNSNRIGGGLRIPLIRRVQIGKSGMDSETRRIV